MISDKSNEPEITGRFNFISYKPDLYDLVFKPFDSPILVVVARNLTREEMDETRKELNASLDETARDINDRMGRLKR